MMPLWKRRDNARVPAQVVHSEGSKVGCGKNEGIHRVRTHLTQVLNKLSTSSCWRCRVSGAISHNLSGQDMFVIVLLALALVAAVVLTAIWSRDKDRRKDARDVLDRFLRWHW